MKKIFLASIMVLYPIVLLADEIYLKDRTIIKCTIIQITDIDIEFDPVGPRAFDLVRKDDVIRIRYDNGQEILFVQDRLHLKDGSEISCTIIRVTKDEIIYSPEQKGEASIPRDRVDRIEYSDGKVIYLSRDDERDKDKTRGFYDEKPEGGFHDSIVRIAGFYGFSFPTNGIFDKERRVFSHYRPDLFYAYYIPRDYQIYQNAQNGGAEIDLMPPAIKFKQERGFDFTGIKFGIRGRYLYEVVESSIVDEYNYESDSYEYEIFRGTLMDYHSWAAGPVINLIFSPRSNIFNLLLNFYGVCGQILDGRIAAAAALRHAKLLTARLINGGFLPPLLYHTKFFNVTKFQGFTVRCGLGPHLTLNKYFPITFGLNVTFGYSIIELDNYLPIYSDTDRKTSHYEFGGEVSVGVHF